MAKDTGLSMTRLLPARRELVYDAWTQPELMARWFFPGEGWTARVDATLEVGGAWRVAMLDPQNVEHVQFGEYRELSRPSRLSFTWNCPDLGVKNSLVTIELRERDGQTLLVLAHELPPDPKIRAGHEEGWQGCLGNLEKSLTRVK
jgi:uncharacterized protein YndB with AHSA1/START domain